MAIATSGMAAAEDDEAGIPFSSAGCSGGTEVVETSSPLSESIPKKKKKEENCRQEYRRRRRLAGGAGSAGERERERGGGGERRRKK